MNRRTPKMSARRHSGSDRRPKLVIPNEVREVRNLSFLSHRGEERFLVALRMTEGATARRTLTPENPNVYAAPARRCGSVWKTKISWNGLLTIRAGMLILVSSLAATLLDREAEQPLFDNRYDVPESVRPQLVEPRLAIVRSQLGTLSDLSD